MLKTHIHAAGTQTTDFQIYVTKTRGPKRTEVLRSWYWVNLFFNDIIWVLKAGLEYVVCR